MNSSTTQRRANGFTLLEVLIALAICSVALVVFSMTTMVNLRVGQRTHMRTQAALLIRGVAFDIEATIRKDGLSNNSVSEQPCELPSEFQDKFKCTYDLVKLDIPEETLSELLNQVTARIMGALGGNDDDEKKTTSKPSVGGDLTKNDLTKNPLAAQILGGDKTSNLGLNLSSLTPLMPLLADTTGEFKRFCNFNLQKAMLNFGLVITMFPVLAKEISDRTRQLKVRISWGDGFFSRDKDKSKQFEITTYLTFIGKELKYLDGQEPPTDDGSIK